MANISHEAVLSAAWILMRRTRNTAQQTNEAAAISDSQIPRTEFIGNEADAKEAIRQLISAYLRTPTHISSHFHCW